MKKKLLSPPPSPPPLPQPLPPCRNSNPPLSLSLQISTPPLPPLPFYLYPLEQLKYRSWHVGAEFGPTTDADSLCVSSDSLRRTMMIRFLRKRRSCCASPSHHHQDFLLHLSDLRSPAPAQSSSSSTSPIPTPTRSDTLIHFFSFSSPFPTHHPPPPPPLKTDAPGPFSSSSYQIQHFTPFLLHLSFPNAPAPSTISQIRIPRPPPLPPPPNLLSLLKDLNLFTFSSFHFASISSNLR